MNDIDKFAKDGVFKILVGNKCDLERKREVSTDMLNKLGNKKKIKTFETSAKTGINVSKSFESLAELLVEGKSKEELNNLYRRETIKITGIKNNKKSEKKECCK
jgi:GTPase SAR1 family protein